MVIDIRIIPEGHSEVSQETDLGDLKKDLPPLCGKISGSAAIDRMGTDLYIHLQFHGTFELECSRCVEGFRFPVDGDIRAIAKERAGKHSPEGEVDLESIDIFYDNRDLTLDLNSLIYEEIMIALPLKPLCSESCKGLEKYTVGASSFEKGADGKKEVDPRWDALKKLQIQKGF
jgi:uncharacterized protein